MKVVVSRQGTGYVADCVNLPGTPPVGRGVTADKAVIQLLAALLLLVEQAPWRPFLDRSSFEIEYPSEPEHKE